MHNCLTNSPDQRCSHKVGYRDPMVKKVQVYPETYAELHGSILSGTWGCQQKNISPASPLHSLILAILQDTPVRFVPYIPSVDLRSYQRYFTPWIHALWTSGHLPPCLRTTGCCGEWAEVLWWNIFSCHGPWNLLWRMLWNSCWFLFFHNKCNVKVRRTTFFAALFISGNSKVRSFFALQKFCWDTANYLILLAAQLLYHSFRNHYI